MCSSWTFTCTNLWKRCVTHSVLLQDLPANSPVFVHQIDLQSPVLQKETLGSFYLDELIIVDRAVIGKGISFVFFPPGYSIKSIAIKLDETFSKGNVTTGSKIVFFSLSLHLFFCDSSREGITKILIFLVYLKTCFYKWNRLWKGSKTCRCGTCGHGLVVDWAVLDNSWT